MVVTHQIEPEKAAISSLGIILDTFLGFLFQKLQKLHFSVRRYNFLGTSSTQGGVNFNNLQKVVLVACFAIHYEVNEFRQ